jgi:putative transposase
VSYVLKGASEYAVTESLFGSPKVERLHGMRFDTRRVAKNEVIDWITFYNPAS